MVVDSSRAVQLVRRFVYKFSSVDRDVRVESRTLASRGSRTVASISANTSVVNLRKWEGKSLPS